MLSTEYSKPSALRQTVNQQLLKEDPQHDARNAFKLGPRHSKDSRGKQVRPEDQVENIVDDENWSEEADVKTAQRFGESL